MLAKELHSLVSDSTVMGHEMNKAIISDSADVGFFWATTVKSSRLVGVIDVQSLSCCQKIVLQFNVSASYLLAVFFEVRMVQIVVINGCPDHVVH